jgi:hypothetical protein
VPRSSIWTPTAGLPLRDKRANDLLLACGFIKWRAKKLNMDTNSWTALKSCGFIKWRAQKLNMDTNSWTTLKTALKSEYEAQYGQALFYD